MSILFFELFLYLDFDPWRWSSILDSRQLNRNKIIVFDLEGRLLNNLIEISVYFLVYLFLFKFSGGGKMEGITGAGYILLFGLAIIGVLALRVAYKNRKNKK